ncbi:MAG: FecCD family ABC transporter permease [Guyparkeria sp.]
MMRLARLTPWTAVAPAPGDRSRRAGLVLAGLFPAVLLAALIGLATGPTPMPLHELLAVLSGINDDPLLAEVVWNLRLPRVIGAIIVGAALGAAGVALQGLFRNPLADPGLVGVAAGASLGAVGVIVLGATWLAPLTALTGSFALPIAAFIGALAATALVYRLAASRNGQAAVATLLLAGIAINAIAGAATGLLVYAADDQQLRSLTFWSMGSLAHAGWPLWTVSGLMVAIALALLPRLAAALNGLMLGEAVATHLGFPVDRIKRAVIVLVALAVGAAVAAAGTIGFVGLVVPHLLRMVIGPDHRYLLPASALGGALLLLLADAIARVIVSPAELPIGLLTALIGGPFFLWLLMRQTRHWG